LNGYLFDCFAVEEYGWVKSVWHGISTLISLLVLLVIPVPVAAFLAPLIANLLIIVFLTIPIIFLFIFAVLASLLLFCSRFNLRLSTLVYDLSLLVLFGLFRLLLVIFFLLFGFLLIVVIVGCAALLGLSVKGSLLG
jgi:hypothetical protein